MKNIVSEVKHPKVVVGKMEAAYQQIESAIEIFFNDGNLISVHTLVGAAHGILYDLGKEKGLKSILKNLDKIKPEFRGKYIKAVNSHQNFFKHADKDGDISIEFPKNITELYLMDAIGLYQQLGGKNTSYINVYNSWFFISHPDLLNEGEVKEMSFEFNKNNLFLNSKDIARQALKRLTHKDKGGIIAK